MQGTSSSTWLRLRPCASDVRPRLINRLRCCSASSDEKPRETRTPILLKIAVGGATQLLSVFSRGGRGIKSQEPEDKTGVSITGVDDVVSIIRSDYGRNYFVTGNFTRSVYAVDCKFEDPTIEFRGRELYSRNLSFLVPFLENPSIELRTLDKGTDSNGEFIVASWRLTTHIRFPWKPLVRIDGRTVYNLDEGFRIVRHMEEWEISAIEAIVQLFTPGTG